MINTCPKCANTLFACGITCKVCGRGYEKNDYSKLSAPINPNFLGKVKRGMSNAMLKSVIEDADKDVDYVIEILGYALESKEWGEVVVARAILSEVFYEYNTYLKKGVIHGQDKA